MSNDWRYVIQYLRPGLDAVINKLSISEVKYEIYKYLKNPINTIIKSAISKAQDEINDETEFGNNIVKTSNWLQLNEDGGCSSYKRYISVIHEEREKVKKSEWRIIHFFDCKKLEKYGFIENFRGLPEIGSSIPRIGTFTYNEFRRYIKKCPSFSTTQESSEVIYEIWENAIPVLKRDPVHEIYRNLRIFERLQQLTMRRVIKNELFEPDPRITNRVYSYRPLKKNNYYEEIFWYSQHDNYSCGFIQYLSNSDKAKRTKSCRKIKYEQNRRTLPCKKIHSITDLYYICKNFGIDVSDIDIKTTTKNVLMQKIYPNLQFI